MAQYTQAGRPLAFKAGLLGDNDLLLEAVSGAEAVSDLFRFELDLLAGPGTDVPFDQVLGLPATVALRMPGDAHRYVSGVVGEFAQGAEVRGPDGDVTFVRYRATLVPAAWLLTLGARCRTFQQKTVPEILTTRSDDPKERGVLAGLDLKVQLLGRYEPRDYCVQYRESDWAFASRLMEEEGIYYYFSHSAGGHTLVLADHPQAHADVPGPAALIYDPTGGGNRPEGRVTAWGKTQEVRAARVTLRDHTFELPHQDLEAKAKVPERVSVGSVAHNPRAGGDGREFYDHPGGHAGRFDGVDPGGSDQPGELKKAFADGDRTARVRAGQEAARALAAHGESDCRHLTAGHAFSLTRHFNADGKYVLTRVEHRASLGGVYTRGPGDPPPVTYSNRFRCVPADLPFRPARTTPRPSIPGAQTAVVTGPPGEEIFTDKYGRVKVRFHWDRDGSDGIDSSCWVRVSQVHAGKNWGGIDIPRVGEEVVVAFEEGDPDRPVVVGRVYNAREMPPFKLPKHRMVSGVKTNTYPGGGGFNQLTLDDTKGKEVVFVHAQRDRDEVTEHDQTTLVKNDRKEEVGRYWKVVVGDKLEIVCGKSRLVMEKGGKVTIEGTEFLFSASGPVQVRGKVIDLN